MPYNKKTNNTVKIYGKHAVLEALANKSRKHFKVITTQEVYHKFQKQFLQYNIKIEIKKEQELNAICPNSVHQGMILQTSPIFLHGIEHLGEITSFDKSCIVILDQITDPQNIGAIIRSALAFEIDAVILPSDNAPPETAAMAKASSGAIEKVPIIKVKNLATTIKQLQKQNYWITGLDSNSKQSITDAALSKKTVLILGSEHKGLRELTKANCDFIVKLPMSDKLDSINVSNAAAIAMYEYFKGVRK
jgi:23S rRNA (guanosine2251-2'-O)-methyltransferase